MITRLPHIMMKAPHIMAKVLQIMTNVPPIYNVCNVKLMLKHQPPPLLPHAYPRHLMSFSAREGGNLMNLVFPGAGHLISTHRGWGIWTLSWISYNVPVKSMLQHPPPRQPPRHLNFWKIFVQIPSSRGRKAVQMPHHRSIPGDQMPPPLGNFSVAFIMLRKLWM